MNNIEYEVIQKELPIFSTNISNFKRELDLASQAILELRKQNPESIESNVKASYVSGWGSHLENVKFTPLVDLIQSFCQEVSKEYFNVDVKYKCVNCWGMLYEPGDRAILHNHFPAVFAAIVYIDVEKDSSPIIFENNLTVIPSPGSVLLFPAILNHIVPETRFKRKVVSMNFHVE